MNNNVNKMEEISKEVITESIEFIVGQINLNVAGMSFTEKCELTHNVINNIITKFYAELSSYTDQSPSGFFLDSDNQEMLLEQFKLYDKQYNELNIIKKKIEKFKNDLINNES